MKHDTTGIPKEYTTGAPKVYTAEDVDLLVDEKTVREGDMESFLTEAGKAIASGKFLTYQEAAGLINHAVKEAVEAEREACAALVEHEAREPSQFTHESVIRWGIRIAKAIRARGVKEG